MKLFTKCKDYLDHDFWRKTLLLIFFILQAYCFHCMMERRGFQQETPLQVKVIWIPAGVVKYRNGSRKQQHANLQSTWTHRQTQILSEPQDWRKRKWVLTAQTPHHKHPSCQLRWVFKTYTYALWVQLREKIKIYNGHPHTMPTSVECFGV